LAEKNSFGIKFAIFAANIIKKYIMVNLIIKNLKEIEESVRDKSEELIKSKTEFYQELFKKYDKDLTIEVIVNKSASTYTISASIDLKSKKVLLAEEGKDAIQVITKLFNEFKKAVKRQYELERKDYEYKRKR
jgi:predicted RNA-binding protein Jag